MFHQRGVARTTLEEIAREAGVTRGAIYWHFRNKNDLFDALHQQTVLPMQEVAYCLMSADDKDALERLETFCVDALVQLHECGTTRCSFSVLFLKCEESDEMEGLIERKKRTRAESTERLAAFFRQLRDGGKLSRDFEPRLLAIALHDFMSGLFIGYLRAPESYRMPGDAAKLVGYFFAPLRQARVGVTPGLGESALS